jgi:hypothetical protein
MLAEDERLEHELRREFGDPPLPWGPGAHAASMRDPVRAQQAEPQQAWRPSPPVPSTKDSFGASPLTPADIEAILARAKK